MEGAELKGCSFLREWASTMWQNREASIVLSEVGYQSGFCGKGQPLLPDGSPRRVLHPSRGRGGRSPTLNVRPLSLAALECRDALLCSFALSAQSAVPSENGSAKEEDEAKGK